MTASGLDVFDKSLQTTNVWLNEIVAEIGPDRQVAWHVLGAVLRTIRNRIPLDLAAHLGAELPLIVRGAYYDQFRPSEAPDRSRTLDEFLQDINEDLQGIRPVGPRDAAHAVFRVLSRHIDAGQVEKIRQAMPEGIRQSWDTAVQESQEQPMRSGDEPALFRHEQGRSNADGRQRQTVGMTPPPTGTGEDRP